MEAAEKVRVLRGVSDHALNGLEKFFGSVKVKESGPAVVSMTLLISAAEEFRAMLLLLDNGAGTRAAGPVRSMLEGLADMILLSKDPAYVDQLKFDNAKSDAATLERYLNALANADGTEAQIESLKVMLGEAVATRDALKAKGYKRQTREDKFELSGVDDLYVSYGILCTFVHPNITSLTARHVDESTFAYRRPAAAEVIAMVNSIGLRVLTASIELLPSFTDARADAVANLVGEIQAPHKEAMSVA